MLFYFLVFLAMAAWGASWVSGKMISKTVPFQVTLFWRHAITLISFLPMMIFLKQSFRLTQKALIRIFITSLILFSINQLFFLGLQNGFAGIGGVLVPTLNPILVFLLSFLIFRKKFHFQDFIVLFTGLIGGFFILQIWNINLEKLILSGNLFFILCALGWAALTLSGNWSLEKTTVWIYSFYLYLFSTIIQFFFTLSHSFLIVFTTDFSFWINLIIVSLFSNTFSTTVYFIASKKIGSHKASSFSFLVPFTAVLFSWLLLGEIPQISTLIGGILAVFSVYWINFHKS